MSSQSGSRASAGPAAASLDGDACYRAISTRDERFDGRFFVGVTSTGVFCRPVCPARTPKRANCVFLPCAAAAREAGFRPCLRCRPETAPGTPAWAGTSATVARALRLIEDGALDDDDLPGLADRLGVGDRHLRRLFAEHVGASPGSVAQTRRLLFAKKLIDETDLPMARVAHAAGFRSVRRFNAEVRRTWDRSPSELRRLAPGRGSGPAGTATHAAPRGSAPAPAPAPATSGPGPAQGLEVCFRLRYRKPFDWAGLIRFFESHALPGVELVRRGALWRTVVLGGATGWLCVEPAVGEDALLARVGLDRPTSLTTAADRVRALFDLRADPLAIGRHLSLDERLRPPVAASPGRRVPGCWDPFELAVRAILGQEVSVKGGITFARRLVERCGRPLELAAPAAEAGLTHAFPDAPALAAADLGGLGLTGMRVRALRGLAEAVAAEPDLLSPGRPLDEAVARLCALPGIGPWTAHYIALRALGEPDAFPAGDLVLRQRLGTKAAPIAERELARRAEAWRPWRGYAALWLWGEPSPEA